MGLPGAFVELLFDLFDDAARIARWARENFILVIALVTGGLLAALLVARFTDDSPIFTAAFWEQDPEGIRNLFWAAATIVAGAAGLYGLSLAARRTAALDAQADVAQAQRALAEQAQITERFTKAVEQLGHENMAVRLGGVYALERIAKDSERDFDTIMETLAAFVRDRAPWPPRGMDVETAEAIGPEGLSPPPIDVVATLTVLARAIPLDHHLRNPGDPMRIDLRTTNLCGLDLPNAQFAGFRFDNAHLDGAFLRGGNLKKASLQEACLKGALLWDTDLESATMSGAHLGQARLGSTCLNGADLSDANLEGAILFGSRLENAHLFAAQLAGAALSGARLNGADLAYANFKEAYLSRTNFEGANVTEANFEDARDMSEDQLMGVLYAEQSPPIDLPEGITLPPPAEGLSNSIPF